MAIGYKQGWRNTGSVNEPNWIRPSDWLPMPTVTSNEQTFVGLHAVIENGDNYVAFSFTTDTGLYQVDWGDGTITTHISNNIAQYQYDFNTYDTSNTTLCSRGYKQVIITITPVIGNLIGFNFNQRFVTSPIQNQIYSTQWLECKTSMPNALAGNNVLRFSGNLTTPITIGVVRNTYLESFDIVNIGTTATFLRGFFFGCTSLQNVVINADTSNVIDLISMFNGCTSLKNLPLFNTQSVTQFSSMFANCTSLREVPLFNTISAASFSNMFQGCTSLREIPLFNTSNVTNMSNMLQGCNSLENLPLLDTIKVTAMTSMIRECNSINYIPPLSTVSSLSMLSFLINSSSVNKCDMIFRISVGINNCQFSQQELINIFINLLDRTSLPTANINITGNWGASALSPTQRAIALNKNWTITG